MNATANTTDAEAASEEYLPEVGDRVRWSSALWTVTERDGPLARLERVGTVPVFGVGVLWVGESLVEPTSGARS